MTKTISVRGSGLLTMSSVTVKRVSAADTVSITVAFKVRRFITRWSIPGNPDGQAQVSFTADTIPLLRYFRMFCLRMPPATVGGAIQFFSKDFQAPLINQYDLILEHQICEKHGCFGFLYRQFGTKFADLFWSEQSNAPVQTTYTVYGGLFDGQTFTLPLYTRFGGAVGTQAMTRIQSTVKSEYNALVLQFNRRFTNGLQFQNSYTFAKSTDTNQNSATFTQTNSPYDILDGSYDHGPSNFDVRHKFVSQCCLGTDDLQRQSQVRWAITFSMVGQLLRSSHTIRDDRMTEAFREQVWIERFGDNRLPILERNAFRLPSLINLDARLSKRFKLTETMNLEFLAEGFQYCQPDTCFRMSILRFIRTDSFGTNGMTTKSNGSPNPSFGELRELTAHCIVNGKYSLRHVSNSNFYNFSFSSRGKNLRRHAFFVKRAFFYLADLPKDDLAFNIIFNENFANQFGKEFRRRRKTSGWSG